MLTLTKFAAFPSWDSLFSTIVTSDIPPEFMLPSTLQPLKIE
jgi:hypothetical protein